VLLRATGRRFVPAEIADAVAAQGVIRVPAVRLPATPSSVGPARCPHRRRLAPRSDLDVRPYWRSGRARGGRSHPPAGLSTYRLVGFLPTDIQEKTMCLRTRLRRMAWPTRWIRRINDGDGTGKIEKCHIDRTRDRVAHLGVPRGMALWAAGRRLGQFDPGLRSEEVTPGTGGEGAHCRLRRAGSPWRSRRPAGTYRVVAAGRSPWSSSVMAPPATNVRRALPTALSSAPRYGRATRPHVAGLERIRPNGPYENVLPDRTGGRWRAGYRWWHRRRGVGPPIW